MFCFFLGIPKTKLIIIKNNYCYIKLRFKLYINITVEIILNDV